MVCRRARLSWRLPLFLLLGGVLPVAGLSAPGNAAVVALPLVTPTASPSATLPQPVIPSPSVIPIPSHTPSPSAAASPSATPSSSATPVTRYSLAAAWPMAGHDPGQSYADPLGSIVPAAVPLLHLRWQATGYTPAVEAGGVAYLLDGDGRVRAADAATGVLRHQYWTLGVLSLAYQAPYLYFERQSEIRIVEAATGNWLRTAVAAPAGQGAMLGGMIVDGSRLYTGVNGVGGSYYAFDAGTGRSLWARPGAFTSVPCLAFGTLYLSSGPFGSADSFALDAANGFQFRVLPKLGAIGWTAAGGMVYASVLRGGGNALRATIRAYTRFGRLVWVAHDILVGAALDHSVFGVAPGVLDARDSATGHRLWKASLPGLQSVAPGAVAVSGDLVIVQAGDGRIYLLNRDSGALESTLRPPFTAAGAGNLLVGGDMILESVGRRLAHDKVGTPVLLAFGP